MPIRELATTVAAATAEPTFVGREESAQAGFAKPVRLRRIAG